MHVKHLRRLYADINSSTTFTLLEESSIIYEIKSTFLILAFKAIER